MVRRHVPVWFALCLGAQVPVTPISKGIGIQSGITIGGMTVIGRDRRMRGLIGSDLTTMESSFMQDIGTGIAAMLITITNGTRTAAIGTMAGITTTITTTTTMTATTTAARNRLILGACGTRCQALYY